MKEFGSLKKGFFFFAKSAYFVDCARKKLAFGETSTKNDIDNRWKNIWDLQVLGVVKVFMWKAGNDLLPTRKNLLSKRIVTDARCPICKSEEETHMHVL